VDRLPEVFGHADLVPPSLRLGRCSHAVRSSEGIPSLRRRHLCPRRPTVLEEPESRLLLSDHGVAQLYEFVILGTMDEQNASVNGRLAVGGDATLTKFDTATAHADDNGGGTHRVVVRGHLDRHRRWRL
jgi:Putative Ice-binding-like adhesive domain